KFYNNVSVFRCGTPNGICTMHYTHYFVCPQECLFFLLKSLASLSIFLYRGHLCQQIVQQTRLYKRYNFLFILLESHHNNNLKTITSIYKRELQRNMLFTCFSCIMLRTCIHPSLTIDAETTT
ncbi:hypothetical protein ACJX0J_018395, partial [Zea mays]